MRPAERRRPAPALARLVLLLAVALAPSPAPAQDGAPPVVVRVFTLKFRRAEDAAALVRPLLSEKGSVLLHARPNTLTVRDVAPAVQRTAQAISGFDVPPRPLSISVTLLKASAAQAPAAARRPLPPELRRVGERLGKLFNFRALSAVDTVLVQGTEGDAVGHDLGDEHRLEFLLQPSDDPDVARLQNLVLSRVRREGASERSREVVRASINVPLGPPYVLGVGRDESASSALFLVFVAHGAPEGPGPGIAGVR